MSLCLCYYTQSDKGGVITTGGGFSGFYPQPTYQSSAVAAYLSSAAGTAAAAGFNRQGRAYPDLAAIGVNYPTYIGGVLYSLYGTSASAPVVAALCKYATITAAAARLCYYPSRSLAYFLSPSSLCS